MIVELVFEPGETDSELFGQAREVISPSATLEEAHEVLRALFQRYYVHVGGRHLAVHTRSGDPRRLVFIREVMSPIEREAREFRERCSDGDSLSIGRAEQ